MELLGMIVGMGVGLGMTALLLAFVHITYGSEG